MSEAVIGKAVAWASLLIHADDDKQQEMVDTLIASGDTELVKTTLVALATLCSGKLHK